MKGTALAAVTFLAATVVHAQDPPGLEDLFAPGGVLEDRNGDGFVDFVNASLDSSEKSLRRTSLPRLPTWPLVSASRRWRWTFRSPSAPRALPSASESTRPISAPGEGRIELGAGGLVLSGADGAGLRAAAKMVAGRLPHLWDVEGPTFETLIADAAAALGVETVGTRIGRLRVRADGVERLALEIELAAPATRDARAALERALTYPGVREIAVTLVAGGTSQSFRVTRAPEPPEAGPLPARPGAGAKRSLDLSNLYTPDGLLGDS